VSDVVEFVDDPDPGPANVEDARRPRRRAPLVLLLTVAVVLAGGVAARHRAGSGHDVSSAHRVVATATRTPAAAVAVRPRSGPPGCPPGVFCDVSRDQVPAVLRAVQRHFPGATTLTTYTVLRTGEGLRAGGLQYRQDASTAAGGLLVITIRARPTPPPYPSLQLTASANVADLRVNAADFDVDLQFTCVDRRPVSGQLLVALADEPALTDVA
jgi:hypothetical protein